MTTDPNTPAKYYHRFLQKLVSLQNSALLPTPEELDTIAEVFKKAGGSWESLQLGSSKDVLLIKKVVVIAVKKKLISRKPKFDGKVKE